MTLYNTWSWMFHGQLSILYNFGGLESVSNVTIMYYHTSQSYQMLLSSASIFRVTAPRPLWRLVGSVSGALPTRIDHAAQAPDAAS